MRLVVFLTIAAALSPSLARAQAWTPPAQSGSISVSFQGVNHTGHLYTDGSYKDESRNLSAAAYLDIEYGITRRLAAAFSVPEVWGRYYDNEDPPYPIAEPDICRCWHAALQDFGFTARYSLIDTFDHVLMATPLVSVGTPSHSYAYHGESVAGRRLSEMRIGADVSYRVDAISRNLSLNVLYTYAFVEKVLDIGTNRSNLSVDGHYQLGRKWEVAGFVAWQRTHGGLRVGAEGTDLVPPGEVNTPERFENHDRLLRENWTHIGTEASFRWGITRLFASYTYVVMGTDAHSGHALLGGIAVPFSFER